VGTYQHVDECIGDYATTEGGSSGGLRIGCKAFRRPRDFFADVSLFKNFSITEVVKGQSPVVTTAIIETSLMNTKENASRVALKFGRITTRGLSEPPESALERGSC
jgi:hypothetical protein